MLIVIVCPPYSEIWIIIRFFLKPPTYPSPKPTSTLTSHLLQNVGLGEGWVGGYLGSSYWVLTDITEVIRIREIGQFHAEVELSLSSYCFAN